MRSKRFLLGRIAAASARADSIAIDRGEVRSIAAERLGKSQSANETRAQSAVETRKSDAWIGFSGLSTHETQMTFPDFRGVVKMSGKHELSDIVSRRRHLRFHG